MKSAKTMRKAPKHLGDLAKQMWVIVTTYLDRADAPVQDIDDNLIELYCTQFEIYRTAYESIKKDGIQTEIWKSVQNSAGEVIGKDFQGYRRNPATAIADGALKQLSVVGGQLGLSPKSRAELANLGNSAAAVDVKAALGDLLGGKS
ncbi:phage terminase small subunit P27 family [Lacticaseibacillus nasuensis]|uniref:phage terminase small subunit P27 family n=1 Tax=Lacticaseibacillus nasuensis TaxID=944671 RepID=UPI002247F6C3|nr:phage terminase small subunit P27 family [Lacticaseibacillus nasuensis]MCX2455633.1 phage terminase small subunit P27 family [Lacticaseibacillus nasuensis]